MRRQGMLFQSFDLQRRFLVSPGQRVIVGRRPPREPQNVRIPLDTISRQHVRITGAAGGYIVEDAGSTSGASVNGERLGRGVVPVGPGDRIDLSQHAALAVRHPWAGESLADLLAVGPLGVEAGVIMARDVINALMPLYFAGVAHGNVDPDHVLRGDDGRWIVLAHGWSVLDDDGPLSCNPLYVAPEVGTLGLSPAGDLYSLGLVLFEAICGRRPFGDGDPAQVQMGKLFGAAPTWEPGWPDWLQTFFLHLFAVEPAHRPGHIKALGKLDGRGDDCSRAGEQPER